MTKTWSVGAEALEIFAVAANNGLAFDPHQTWAFHRAGLSGFRETPFRCDNGERATMCHQITMPPTAFGSARALLLLEQVLEQLSSSLRRMQPKDRLGLFLAAPTWFMSASSHVNEDALTIPRNKRATVVDALLGWFERRNRTPEIQFFADGHASLGSATIAAANALDKNRIDVALVAGFDTYYDPEVVNALLLERRLFDLEHVDRMIPGEGAAAFLVARASVRKRIALKTLGRLVAAATSDEPHPMTSPEPCQGMGLAHALRSIRAVLEARDTRLAWILGDLNHEPYRVAEFQLAYPRFFAPGGLDRAGEGSRDIAAENMALDFLPNHFGDLGAATMPTALVIAVEAFRRENPTRRNALIFGCSVGSLRGAVLVEAPS